MQKKRLSTIEVLFKTSDIEYGMGMEEQLQQRATETIERLRSRLGSVVDIQRKRDDNVIVITGGSRLEILPILETVDGIVIPAAHRRGGNAKDRGMRKMGANREIASMKPHYMEKGEFIDAVCAYDTTIDETVRRALEEFLAENPDDYPMSLSQMKGAVNVAVGATFPESFTRLTGGLADEYIKRAEEALMRKVGEPTG